MASPTWYLGPIGDLRALSCPEPDISMPVERYGGVHQGLSGARQADITGFRQNIPLEFTYMDYSEWSWLEALHTRLVPGPYYLVNPMKKNRLVLESSFPKAGGGTARGAELSVGASLRQADWPTGVGAGGWSVKWFNRSGSGFFRIARNNPAAVLPGEQVTVSAYFKASAAINIGKYIDYYDRSGQNGGTGFIGYTPITTAWTRVSHTVTVPAGIGAIDPVWFAQAADSGVDISIAAAQVEAGPTATNWELGGGSMKTVIDQMPAVSPIYPLTNVTVNLLEA